MRIVTILLFFLFACSRPDPALPSEPGGQRGIQACIVNDADAPVSYEVVYGALTRVFREYSDRTGIVFIPTVWIVAPFKPSGWPMDTAFHLGKVCPAHAEVRFVFTNRFVAPKDASMTLLGDGGQMAGDSHPYFGFVIIYSAEERWAAKDASGGRAIFGTLRHEIGHLFGLEHIDDRASFMYKYSDQSYGRWTSVTIDAVRRQKWRRWWPRG